VTKNSLLLIADSHQLFRRCLVSVLAADQRFERVEEAESFDEALSKPALHRADIFLLGLNHDRLTGIEMTRTILGRSPQVKLLLLGQDDSEDQILEYLRQGARGYVFRSQPLPELLTALEVVARGDTSCSPEVAHRLFSRLGNLGREQRQRERLELLCLTSRELQILRLIADGMSNQEIAGKLFLSVHTVKNHVHKILDTMGVSSRLAAVNQAFAKGWLHDRRRGS
jgi:DNA-binding NarL/FixJ family response regulator